MEERKEAPAPPPNEANAGEEVASVPAPRRHPTWKPGGPPWQGRPPRRFRPVRLGKMSHNDLRRMVRSQSTEIANLRGKLERAMALLETRELEDTSRLVVPVTDPRAIARVRGIKP